MRLGARLCLCLLLISFTVLSCSARTTMLLSDENFVLGTKGRSLSVRANDYDEPIANRGHDPPSSSPSRSGRAGNGGSRRG
ncbi:protein PSY3-like [Morus notabilis]|uniref:protein PSY3-like n=1 Tax=Morus notabilis TaxID=981085 RepID=UPI000CED70F1|nr:protein PSY3-like [Morus notabilis]